MESNDIDCIIIGEALRAELEKTLQSLSEVKYFRGKLFSFVVGTPSVREVVDRFEGVTFIEDPSTGKNRAKARNVGWDAGTSPLVQFLEVGDQLNPDWFQRATKEVLAGVGAICGRIEPANPDVNRWHRIAYLESRIDLEEGRLTDVEPLLRREVLEETGGFNESLAKGSALEFNARLASKGRRVIHLNFPMVKRVIDIPNWKAYWREGVRSGYRMGACASKGKGLTCARDPLLRGGGAVLFFLLAIVGLCASPLALLLLLPSAFFLFRPRIFHTEKVATQEGFSNQDAALYTWHRSFVVLPELWGVIRYSIRRIWKG